MSAPAIPDVATPHRSTRFDLRILNALRRMIRAADIDSRRLAAAHQITAPQLVSLLAVAEAGRMTAIEVARRVHLGASTLVGVMSRLEAKGLITRERDAEDRRQVWIKATEAGRQLISKVPFPLQHALNRALEQMSDEQRMQAAGCMELLAELMALKELDDSPILEIIADGAQEKERAGLERPPVLEASPA